MKTFNEAVETLNSRDRRKLGNNTYLERRDENTIAVKLHATDVVTFHRDGRIVYNSGGWKTVTTKDRMNSFGPASISQCQSIWYIDGAIYVDGVTVKNGKVLNAVKPGKVEKETAKLKREIKMYSGQFLASLMAGEVPGPSGGDCWYCAMKEVKTGLPLGECTKNADHLRDHIRENYFVPSLMVRAIERFPVSALAKSALGRLWAGEKLGDWELGVTGHQIQKSIYRYMVSQFGLAA